MRALVVSTFLALAACAPVSPAPMPDTADEATAQDTCGMARFQHLVEHRVLASEIDRASLPPATRIITPDTMVTQDFSSQRLNIITGTDGRVSSLRCF